MKLNKDKTELRYNDFLTLTGIPPEVYEYKLGNRSALEWSRPYNPAQYQVSTDKRSNIINDPNRPKSEIVDPQYIVRLIGQVISVSLETVRLVNELATYPSNEPCIRINRRTSPAVLTAKSISLHQTG
jgi:predicted helicase